MRRLLEVLEPLVDAARRLLPDVRPGAAGADVRRPEDGGDADADDAPDAAPSGDASKVSLREMAGEQRAPWHFKLLIVLVVAYLTWRIIQMISWVVT